MKDAEKVFWHFRKQGLTINSDMSIRESLAAGRTFPRMRGPAATVPQDAQWKPVDGQIDGKIGSGRRQRETGNSTGTYR